MTLWLVCLATLALAAWCDIRTRSIPAALAVLPLLFLAWPGLSGVALVGPWPVVLLVGALAGSALVLGFSRVGAGDVALMLPVTLALGLWVAVALAVALAAGLGTLAHRQRPADPFVPHLLAGFLVASGLRWAVGG